jgi:hypothetical protein
MMVGLIKKTLILLTAVFFLSIAINDAICKPKKNPSKNSDNQIITFLKENGIDLSKKVIAIQVTGLEPTEEGPRAVMKIISINDKLLEKKPKTEAEKTSVEFIKGTNKYSADVIKTVVVSIVGGTVVKDGDTPKVADVQVFMENGDSFNVMVGEDFSQIVFETILWKPENPFSSEPVKKSVKTLSFTSPDLLKSVQEILKPKGSDDAK